jgi:ribosomal protein S18 acetylase RimI-like enzyme
MITISKSSLAEIKKFNDFEWIDADIHYYGEALHWVTKNFVFKAEEDGKIVGNIYGKFGSGILYIDDLMVAKDKRGLGIGKALMQKAEEFGLSLKAHKAWLVTGKTWKEPRHFYENLGYRQTGEFLNHYKHQDFVIYEKLLA